MKKHRHLLALFVLLWVSSTQIHAQHSLRFDCNAIRPDSINRIPIPYFDAGCEGENVTWDFSESEWGDSSDTSDIHIYNKQNDIFLWNENKVLTTYKQCNDSLLIYRIESPLYVMNYSEPIAYMNFPLCYGQHYNTRFSGTGSYEGKIELVEEGVCNLHADAYGRIVLAEGDSLDNVLRTHSTITTDVTLTSINSNGQPLIIQKETDIYKWYARGFRYPVIENCEERIIHEGNILAISRNASRIPVETLKNLEDEINEEIRANDSIAYAMSHPIKDLVFTNHGSEGEINYTLNQDAHIGITLADSKGIVYWRYDDNEYAGVSYSHSIPLSGLLRGQYVIYINANGVIENIKVNVE